MYATKTKHNNYKQKNVQKIDIYSCTNINIPVQYNIIYNLFPLQELWLEQENSIATKKQKQKHIITVVNQSIIDLIFRNNLPSFEEIFSKNNQLSGRKTKNFQIQSSFLNLVFCVVVGNN
jgi:hypothetical protein